jgi:hypothetical protein
VRRQLAECCGRNAQGVVCSVQTAHSLVNASHVLYSFVRSHRHDLASQLCCGPDGNSLEHCSATATASRCSHFILPDARHWLFGHVKAPPDSIPHDQWASGLEHQLQMVFPRVDAHGCRDDDFDALELEKSEQTPVAKTVTQDASATSEPN